MELADHQTSARAKTIEINFEKLLQFYYVNCERNEWDNNRFSWIVHGIKRLRIHVMDIRTKFIDDYLNNIELNKNIPDGFFHHFFKLYSHVWKAATDSFWVIAKPRLPWK